MKSFFHPILEVQTCTWWRSKMKLYLIGHIYQRTDLFLDRSYKDPKSHIPTIQMTYHFTKTFQNNKVETNVKKPNFLKYMWRLWNYFAFSTVIHKFIFRKLTNGCIWSSKDFCVCCLRKLNHKWMKVQRKDQRDNKSYTMIQIMIYLLNDIHKSRNEAYINAQIAI